MQYLAGGPTQGRDENRSCPPLGAFMGSMQALHSFSRRHQNTSPHNQINCCYTASASETS